MVEFDCVGEGTPGAPNTFPSKKPRGSLFRGSRPGTSSTLGTGVRAQRVHALTGDQGGHSARLRGREHVEEQPEILAPFGHLV
jgi:hypothetical protein